MSLLSDPPRIQIDPGPGGSIGRRAEAIYHRIRRQRDACRAGNFKTNRPQLKHHAILDDDNPLHTMRLRVANPNNITSAQVTSCDLVHRHVTSV